MLFKLSLVGLVILIIILLLTKPDEEDWKEPNSLVTGRIFGGTVYASYPENSPGLGWIL